jgi:RNA polymerase sigma factor (sigma-70 family)
MRMMTGDEDLARAAAGGDGVAFAALLERHYDRLFGLCWRLTGVRAEAEDLLQDICAGLPAKLRGFRGESRVTTWLWRVAVNAAHDRRRRQATHGRAAAGWGDWELARQAEIEEGRERAEWLHRAMARLGPDLRDTLALVLDDCTHAEAGAILGVSEGTVSWRVSEAKKRLRAMRAEEDAA